MLSKKFTPVFWLYCLAVLLTLLFVGYLYMQTPVIKSLDTDNGASFTFIHGSVTAVGEADELGDIALSVLAEDGIEKGRTIVSPQSGLSNFNKYQVGDRVLIAVKNDPDSGKTIFETVDYYHQGGLFWIFLIFALVAIIIAKKKGATAIASVIISLGLFYFIFLRMVFVGMSPLLACLVFTAIVTILTIPLIHGFNKKSLSAILAIFAGYLVSILIAFWFRSLAGLGDTPAEEFRGLAVMFPGVNMADILITSLFLGAVGALIDTTISISSAVFEALKEHAHLGITKVYRIGMEVGKDVLGSMINTLLFAYLASALPFLLALFLTQGSTFTELVNTDFIALELARTFIGALSLVLVIPITAIISAYFLASTRFAKSAGDK